ncbi:hypothetical protein M2119_000115 [Aurantimicrobium minutum]|uniref:hypothetical protein n=1 Tax=Aurantimicrobium minutum TaxID=708131 RepID=UPI0024760947|nr:hypothetical protein [Aurantimicrobium minutum]MDH6531878.1 hypothetical protein [Aurantimicrobium minutum]
MLSRSEGSVTAELAMVLPAIMVVVSFVLQALVAVGLQLSNASLARQAVRDLSRGTDFSVVENFLAQANSSAHASEVRQGEIVCVHISQELGPGPLALVIPEVRVKECAQNAQ